VWDCTFTVNLGLGLMPDIIYPASCFLVKGFYKPFGFYGGLVGVSPLQCAPTIAYRAFNMGDNAQWAVFCTVNVKLAQDWSLLYRFTILLSNKRFHELLHSRRVVFIIQGTLTVCSFLLSFYSHNVVYDYPVTPTPLYF
jgi:hypothetical protein